MRTNFLLVWTVAAIVAAPWHVDAQSPQKPHAGLEFRLKDRRAVPQLQVEISDASLASPERVSVTDLLLIVRPRSSSPPGPTADAAPPPPDRTAALNVRLFVVAGGRLYSDTKARCGAWENDIAKCSADCDGGDFALRRKGGEDLEFLAGAIPGGSVPDRTAGLLLKPCNPEEGGDIRLVPGTGRGLAVIGLEREDE